MAAQNPTWGEERIANELELKLAIRVSPRTVGKYLRKDWPVLTPDPQQRWLTFLSNHAKAIVACDFFVVITAAFRTLYVFVVMEIGSRRIGPALSCACLQVSEQSPLQRHGPSYGGVDAAAVPGSAAGRSSLPLPHSRSG
jgi:hypothetical protein